VMLWSSYLNIKARAHGGIFLPAASFVPPPPCALVSTIADLDTSP
jgi:hypothetical protein